MSKEKSKVQRAIEYIYAHPATRSDALAKVFDCDPKNVPAFMKDVLAAGLIVSCKVEQPGRKPCHEYKPSAAAPDKCPDNWLDWKRANAAAPVKPLHFKATGPRDGLQKKGSDMSETPAGGGEITPAAASVRSPLGVQELPVGEADIEAQAGSHGPEEAKAVASDPAASAVDIDISLDNAGQITIDGLKFSVAETRAIGQFLIDTEPAWS